jgi:cyclic beta-1,2-glucan synthetase
VGYYLLDSGLGALRFRIGYRPQWMGRIRDTIRHAPNGFYLIGVEVTTFGTVAFLLSGLTVLTPILAGLLLLLLPATQAAVDFMNNLAGFLIPPRRLPRLDFSEGVPDDCVTMVAVPTLLLSSTQVQGLVRDLEIRYLANPDRNICFALLTDAPDSSQPVDEKDNLVDVCREMIEGLNRQYGAEAAGPFYLFHRSRLFNPVEGTWMGWERKRGKLLELNQLLRNQFDSFPVKVGDLSVLPRIRYVITLDSDTQLPRDSAHKLIGTLAHPLNQAVIDPATNMVVEGYGILQPRVGVSIQSAARSRLASIYSGQTGFDIYTRAVSDVYQDVYGEGIFTGKGIYEVDVLRAVLEQRFPSNTLLSHDLIEGAYARAGLVSDIEVIDDYPSHFSAYSRRKHRWVRGDWQIMRWLLPMVPDYSGTLIPNPISLVSHWKIVDNLRRSLFDPAALLLLLAGWFYLPGGPLYWTIASLMLLFIPVYSQLIFSLARLSGSQIGAKLREAVVAFGKSHFSAFLQIVFLMHQALLSLDAIIRSMVRTTITRRRLLEWETAAEAETTTGRKRTPVDTYLHWAPWMAIGIALLLWLVRPQALPAAGPILFLWFSSRAISHWLNRPPRSHRKQLTASQEQEIRLIALRTWRYFREFSNEETNWLIPDNVREVSGAMANRLSPTNLGLLLNARIAALEMGYLTLPEFVEQTSRTLETALRLPRFRGHFLNWYDTQTLEALEPGFVSTVDSGNLAVCLWTLQEAALSWHASPDFRPMLWKGLRDHVELLAELHPSFAEPLSRHAATMGLDDERSRDALDDVLLLANQIAAETTGDAGWWAVEVANRIRVMRESEASAFSEEIREGLRAIAEISGRLVAEMDFRFLYLRKKKVLSVGYDVSAQQLEPSSYDLLASESRMASFVAIAKGDVPQEAWFHLGRKQALCRGQRVLLSWTGTMFVYLMPTIWMEHYRDTVLEKSVRAAVYIQQKEARALRTPWGISESAYGIPEEGSEYSYAPFGVPSLAVKRMFAQSHVISPYSTFLALLVDPPGAYKNLCKMRDLGWLGSYGFYESADYSVSTGHECSVVRSWMAHHQGLSLLPVCNMLAGSPLQRYFHNEPHVLATELLLHERASNTIRVDTQTDEGTAVAGPPEAVVAAG